MVFDVSSAFNHPETENSTNIIDSVDYYKLSDEYIVGDINRTHLYGDTICLVESDIISAFDMKNGKYLWQINNKWIIKIIDEFLRSLFGIFCIFNHRHRPQSLHITNENYAQ